MPNFHPLDGLTAQEAEAADVREFTGDGTPYLKAPGLKAVKSVRVGRLTLPETRTVKTPKNVQFTEFDVVEHPMYEIQAYPDGTPVLLRSTLSNNGFWQAGERIFIAGDWADAPSTPSVPNITSDGTPGGNEAAARVDPPALPVKK